MKSWLPLAASLALAAPAFAQYDPNSTAAYMPSCQAALDIAQGHRPAADSPDAAKQLQRASACFGAVTVIANVEPFFKPDYAMCAPANTKLSAAQMVTAIMDFLKKHPEQMRDPFHQVAVTALATTWPCDK